jgi:hypothetical protein
MNRSFWCVLLDLASILACVGMLFDINGVREVPGPVREGVQDA